ncbi:acetyl-CoA carboxyl transferase [Streptacidiphilus sp. PB12-B1b]|nr:acetyl-CoA carboxyl transferase [Streptacidiphilus sp. PB12-B1b]
MDAGQLIARILDPGSFRCWDRPVTARPADPAYRASLARARERTGRDEAVTTGQGLLGGRPVALVASEFGFLGGSIGVATAERITRAVERATAERLPLLALPVSGGTRMQEGTAAFLCMVRVTAAVQAHQAAGLPYLTYLRNPTMGGVFASWGTLGHLVLAEPGARLGFLGPRVYEELRGEPLAPEVQRAETLAARGLIDAVVAPDHLRDLLLRALPVLTAGRATAPPPQPSPAESHRATARTGASGAAPADVAAGMAAPQPEPLAPMPADGPACEVGAAPADLTARTGESPASVADERAQSPALAASACSAEGRGLTGDAWGAVLRTRKAERPGVREVLRYADGGALLLGVPGGGAGALVRALAVFDGRPAVLVGQQRAGAGAERPFTAADLRAVRRTALMAEQLGLPLVTVVDTAGAELSAEAELDGVALEIAHCLSTLVALRSPVLAVLLGQGSGGGALALLPADRVLAAEHAWLAPLPPEGASAIVHRDGGHAAELARAQGIGAHDLAAVGLVDQVLPEYPDAAEEPAAFCTRVGQAVSTALTALATQPEAARLAERVARHRRLGDLAAG